MVGGVVVGYYLDCFFKTFPALSALFFFGGLATGTKTAIFIIKKFETLVKEEGNEKLP